MVGNIVMDFIGQSCGIASEVKDMYSLTLLLYILERIACILTCMVHGVHKSISNCFSSFLKNKKKGGGN
jgi:hypothetical protein